MTIESMREIADIMQENQSITGKKQKKPIVANHSGYAHEGSENFEHDDTGSLMNYSGVEDEINNAQSEHEGWEEGYDY